MIFGLFPFQATKHFVEIVNSRLRRKLGPVSWSTAVRFLFARKFDVLRAVALYEQHELTRQREGLTNFDPAKEPLCSELKTGKFTVLVRKTIYFYFFFVIFIFNCFAPAQKRRRRSGDSSFHGPQTHTRAEHTPDDVTRRRLPIGRRFTVSRHPKIRHRVHLRHV